MGLSRSSSVSLIRYTALILNCLLRLSAVGSTGSSNSTKCQLLIFDVFKYFHKGEILTDRITFLDLIFFNCMYGQNSQEVCLFSILLYLFLLILLDLFKH